MVTLRLMGKMGNALRDGGDAVDVRPRASQEQHVACFIAAARSLSLIAEVYTVLK